MEEIIKSDADDPSTHKTYGTIDFQGIKVTIENKAGQVRSGTDDNGERWSTKLFYPYGFIKNTEGVDGDEVDCYIGPHNSSPVAFVVHQLNPDTKQYDEDKVMLGFQSLEQARDAYLAHYDSHKFLGEITVLTITDLKELLKTKGKDGVKLTKSYVQFCIDQLLKAMTVGDIVRFRMPEGYIYENPAWVIERRRAGVE